MNLTYKKIISLVLALAIVVGSPTSASAAKARSTRTAKKATTNISTAVQVTNGVKIIATNEKLQKSGLAALALIKVDYNALFPGWTISFSPARSTELGMTLVAERRIEIYLRSDRTPAGLAHDLGHEMGHAFDVTYNTDQARHTFLDIRNRPNQSWWICDRCTDLSVGAGDFAETFSLIVAPTFKFLSTLAPQPTTNDLDTIKATVLGTTFQAAQTK